MEAMLGQSLQFATWIDPNKLERRKLRSSLQVSSRMRTDERFHVFISDHSQWNRASTLRVAWKALSHNCRNSPGSVLQSESFPASFDDNEILESKAKKLQPHLDGRCIFLVGMMGSGKTTIGKILAMSLGYSFFDCDTLIEQAVGGTPVAEIFKLHGESFFRDNESEVLRKLSVMQQLVVSTGGGAVVRPINWKYMQKGITVWLDVPMEALARRIAAVGTQSRPLLEQESGNEYSKAFTRLSSLWEERGKSYANANATVSLENIAAKLGYVDVCNLSPTVITIEVLEQVESFLKSK